MSSGPTNHINVDPADYTWDHATTDLALMTTLTLREASTFTLQLSFTELVPYDAVPRLMRLLEAETGQAIGDALRVLITGDDRGLYELLAVRRDAAAAAAADSGNHRVASNTTPPDQGGASATDSGEPVSE